MDGGYVMVFFWMIPRPKGQKKWCEMMWNRKGVVLKNQPPGAIRNPHHFSFRLISIKRSRWMPWPSPWGESRASAQPPRSRSPNLTSLAIENWSVKSIGIIDAYWCDGSPEVLPLTIFLRKWPECCWISTNFWCSPPFVGEKLRGWINQPRF